MIPPRTPERELIRKLRFYGEVYDYQREAADALEQSLTDIARLREALQKIAKHDVGLQALIEDGEDTPDKVANYYAMQIERRRKIARAALKAGVDD